MKKARGGKKNVLLAAPNGAGKTVIALSALLPIALENDLKIVYMCRTHAQNTRIIKELVKISEFLKKQGFNEKKINGLSIRGRNEMCLNQTLVSLNLGPSDAMSVCKNLRDNQNCIHYLNLEKKRKEDLESPILIAPELFNKPVDAEELLNMCRAKKICPYFLAKYLLSEMSVVICNYQWIFNPFIRDSFLKFIGRDLQNCILILDECHNIIDVATEVNSDRITPYSLRLSLKDLELYRSPILMQSFVNMLINLLDKKKEELKKEEETVNPSIFIESVYKKIGITNLSDFIKFLMDMHDFSVSIHEEKESNGKVSKDNVGSLVDFWLRWIDTYALDSYFFCFSANQLSEKKSTALEIVALDPRESSIPILKNCYTSLNLSGSVIPFVYNSLMGLSESGKSVKGIIAESPFKKENIRALITEGVDTRKENRTSIIYKKMIEKMNEVLTITPFNVGIFCASYDVLKSLKENGIERVVINNNKKLFIEEPGINASENAQLLADYKSMSIPPNKGGVLLGVCGGRNSEGEDYPGNYMNAVIIAGFPYHVPTPRVEAKIKYYDKVFNNQGWNFGYLYPAIQRANQAAGRPIRKLDDRGAIIFMDSRFIEKIQWISEWIRKEIVIIPDKKGAIIQYLQGFWNSN